MTHLPLEDVLFPVSTRSRRRYQAIHIIRHSTLVIHGMPMPWGTSELTSQSFLIISVQGIRVDHAELPFAWIADGLGSTSAVTLASPLGGLQHVNRT